MEKTLADRLLAAMAEPPKLLFGTLKFADRCGAKTRSGGRCQNMPRQLGGRCRMHGGNSLRGPEHPRYKDGKYSKYKPVEPMELDALIAQCAAMPPVDLAALFEGDPFEGFDFSFDLGEIEVFTDL